MYGFNVKWQTREQLPEIPRTCCSPVWRATRQRLIPVMPL